MSTDLDLSVCGSCGAQGDTTHWHWLTVDGPLRWAEHGCAYAGRAYEADACSGDDLCDDCLAELDDDDE